MFMKTAVLLNEDFLEMRLGVNTTLAYILAALDLGRDVYLVDVRDGKKVQKLTKDSAQNLIDEYKKANLELVETKFTNQKFVKEVEFELSDVDFDINDCDYLIQRLDPTHAPFPPKGNADYHEFLKEFLADKKIKNQNFNYPVDCYLDKEFPVAINLDLEVKTWMSFIGDETLVEKINVARNFSTNSKIVLKPDNSGQSMGVFAVEFRFGGDNLADLKEKGVENLQKLQIYHIEESLDKNEIEEVILYLLSCQSAKFNSSAKELYNSKIVIQPFIEGVSKGDIRVNIMKKGEEFEVAGVVFRKSLQDAQGDNFTTCVTGNMALPTSVCGDLTIDEIDDLVLKANKIVDFLNDELREKYRRSFELGCDFTLKGDGKTVLLNEVNHLCPALVPVGEAIRKNDSNDDLYKRLRCKDFKYDGGLGLLKGLIKSWA